MGSKAESLGFHAWIANPTVMVTPHAHDDIELNVMLEGSVEYSISGSRLTLEAGQLLIFWAALPHELLRTVRAEYLCATIPLPQFLQWNPPSTMVNELLSGQPFSGPARSAVARQWGFDFSCAMGSRVAAELEMQAAVLRLAGNSKTESGRGFGGTGVDRMRQVIAERYAEDLTINEVADAASLHPNHAMRVFRAHTGSTIGDYLRRYRLAHAKRLLATTNLPVYQVALEAGFGSERRMYEVFRQQTHQTPAGFRSSLGRIE